MKSSFSAHINIDLIAVDRNFCYVMRQAWRYFKKTLKSWQPKTFTIGRRENISKKSDLNRNAR